MPAAGTELGGSDVVGGLSLSGPVYSITIHMNLPEDRRSRTTGSRADRTLPVGGTRRGRSSREHEG